MDLKIRSQAPKEIAGIKRGAPEGFVMPDQRAVFDVALSKVAGMRMRFGEFFNVDLWNGPMVTQGLPGLAAARHENKTTPNYSPHSSAISR